MTSLQFYFVFYSLVLTVYHLSLVFFIISLYFTLLLLIIFYFTFCFLLCLHLNLIVLTLFGPNIWLSIWNCFFCLPNCFANSILKNTVQLTFIIIKITSKLKQSVDSVQQLGRFLGRFRSFPIELKAENYSWSEPVHQIGAQATVWKKAHPPLAPSTHSPTIDADVSTWMTKVVTAHLWDNCR